MRVRYVSLILPVISILVFILQKFIPGFTEMFLLNQSSIPQIYRFLTAIFLHGSVGHLLYNCFAMAFFGIILEKQIGTNKFLGVFFLSGIIANLISVNFYNSSLGASGAIMGVIGVLALIKPLMMVWAFGLILPMFLVAIIWVLGDILGIFIPDNVGNIAHLSGMAVGVLFGIIFLKFWLRIGKIDI
jgi:membrane associated rhomboid family serine protease